tara:strand:- start:3302 stop:5311 length:2010 start_codon:yes stop_codon:yes gene_type:complete
MKRMQFDSDGKLIGVDGQFVSKPSKKTNINKNLKTSASLEFLQKDSEEIEDIFEQSHWNLHSKTQALAPLKFSNNKTQEDIVAEVCNLIKNGTKIIFLHGTCGTGKSAIALNVARVLGKTSIVVPVKTLQKQYEDDYLKEKHIKKSNGQKMKIAMITGRDNHDSLILPGISCASQELPENIKITEKNSYKLREFYKENPFISNTNVPDIKALKRISIAPSNPYWSPIIPASIELKQLSDSKKRKYLGCDNREYIFYHRKPGCSYYDQHLAYFDADVTIFNSAKYKSELSIGRKPLTEIDVIDEADEFLDSLFEQDSLNLTLLSNALRQLMPEKQSVADEINEIIDLINLEEKNKKALGIDPSQIFHIKDTKILSVLNKLAKNQDLEAEILVDELNYSNKALEIAKNFESSLQDAYLTYKKEDDNIYANIVSTNLSAKVKELMNKTKALIFMSGTLHSSNVLKHIFGISDYKVVEAEILNQGAIEIIRTGKEFDCKYSNFSSNAHSREDYLLALSTSLEKSVLPTLIHVNAYKDLPSKDESLDFPNLTPSETLRAKQSEDKTGLSVSNFKKGLSSTLFSTKCSRGVDFPKQTCNSIIFTKYPNPNVQDTFWKILQKTHPEHYWEFYKDKAHREFLQRIFRALRSPDDHVYILSPDIRVLNSIRALQENTK